MMLLPFKAQDFKEHRQTTLQPFYTRVCVCVCVCVCVENGELQCEVGVMLAIQANKVIGKFGLRSYDLSR